MCWCNFCVVRGARDAKVERRRATHAVVKPSCAGRGRILRAAHIHAAASNCYKLPEAEAACEGGEGSSWARTRAHTHLRVGILGCSTTAGCGAKAPSPFCAPQLSWGRHAHDALVGRNNSVHTHIFSKNAVEAEFFGIAPQTCCRPAALTSSSSKYWRMSIAGRLHYSSTRPSRQ